MKTLIVGQAPSSLENLATAFIEKAEDAFVYQTGSAFDPAAGYELILVFEPAIWQQEHRKAVGLIVSESNSKQAFLYGDEPELCKRVAEALQRLGFETRAFGSWQEGLQIHGGTQAWQQWKKESSHERK
ncbi:MAG: hypothetical protein HC912_10855 [Saprospiraceae bacterium]|nr:hypothetical protein [Saprospiraceae bacterium]